MALLTCLMLIAAIAINRDHRIAGYDLTKRHNLVESDTMVVLSDGTMVVNTADLGKDIEGYGGRVPLKIYLKDGKVDRIEAEPNAETPDFFNKAKVVLIKWQGKTPEEGAAMKVDAVSGATYSSTAIIGNVRRGLAYAADKGDAISGGTTSGLLVKNIVLLVVVLAGAIVPLFKKGKGWHVAQMVLNVVVTGLWCGTFLSYSRLIYFASSGFSLMVPLASIVMLIAAFVYPLFGRKSYYCSHLCPLGSAQELAGMACRRKIKMSRGLVKALETFRIILWGVLTVLVLVGVWTAWTDYELFAAFVFRSASVGILIAAAAFLLLSVVVPRPYCRFVCPTGTLFKVAQNSK